MRTENHDLHSKFFVSQYAKFSWERLLRFKMFGISETFLHITVFLRFFCRTVAKNFVRNHLMFQKVSNVRYQKNLCKRTEYHDFQWKSFCIRMPKNFVGVHFVISEKFGYRKISCLRSDITFLRWIYVTFTAYKVGWGTTLWSRIFGTSKTFMLSRGLSRFSVDFLASQYWKTSWVTPSTFQKFPGIETFHAWERKITFFSRKFLSHSSRKTPGNHF